MKALIPRYQSPMSLCEEAIAGPSELEMQALWFEQLYQPTLQTDDGSSVEIIQPGFWNHVDGPDFTRAAVRFIQDGKVSEPFVGSIEVHLQATDWNAHGHHINPVYNETILHIVWEAKLGKAFFPATASFRRVPQIKLASQLIAPWTELRSLCASLLHLPLPVSTPGRCSAALEQLPARKVVEIIRAAGLYRVRQKALRWQWRRRLTSPEQALYEALAEALGFHANQIPMRLVAQRLPWRILRILEPKARLAHLFGLAGFLPDENLAHLQAETRAWLRELWEIWWKVRSPLEFALLSRNHWKLSGIRPLNRPERRLAALSQIVPLIPKLLLALLARDDKKFSQLLLAVRDPFWEKHATLAGTPLSISGRLIGEERIHDILINIFWPMIWLDDPAMAERGLTSMSAAPNSAARVATQRMLVSALTQKQQKEALIQQGLLQIFRDYCLSDCSRCRGCTFPEQIQSWSA